LKGKSIFLTPRARVFGFFGSIFWLFCLVCACALYCACVC